MKNTTHSNNLSLQDKYAPKGICFGCGCLNEKGLKIKDIVHLKFKSSGRVYECTIIDIKPGKIKLSVELGWRSKKSIWEVLRFL